MRPVLDWLPGAQASQLRCESQTRPLPRSGCRIEGFRDCNKCGLTLADRENLPALRRATVLVTQGPNCIRLLRRRGCTARRPSTPRTTCAVFLPESYVRKPVPAGDPCFWDVPWPGFQIERLLLCIQRRRLHACLEDGWCPPDGSGPQPLRCANPRSSGVAWRSLRRSLPPCRVVPYETPPSQASRPDLLPCAVRPTTSFHRQPCLLAAGWLRRDSFLA